MDGFDYAGMFKILIVPLHINIAAETVCDLKEMILNKNLWTPKPRR